MLAVNHDALLPSVRSFIDREHGLFVEGMWTPAREGRTLPVYNPANGREIARIAAADGEDVRLAVASAHRAFREGRWTGLTPAARERILLRFADLIEADADALAQLETLEQGKSIGVARFVEVGGGIDFARYAAGLATKITGMTLDLSIPLPPGMRSTAYTRRQPVGVVAGIAPWNFPFAIALWKVVPALAAGCTVVLKPSEITPLTALRLAELAAEAGVPAGVFNVVTGDGPEAGHALISSELISKISFTGSTATGKVIARTAIDRMTRTSLELGGKNPAIVLDDADLSLTVPGLIIGAFLNQGQVCSAASRLYVQAGIYDRLAAELESAIKGLTVGPGMDPANQVNPLVSAQHRDKVNAFLEEATGNSTLIQGKSGPDGNGFYVPPTLIVDPDPKLRLAREEVFGPVLTMQRVADADEAVRLANDTSYGLAASLWTSNLKSALDLVPRIEAGTVWVNTHIPLDPNLPFGGFKQSGSGREFGPHWADTFTEEKSVCIVH